jgi:cell fate (sporulation/competence/biofilm development) regulator YlbF (YheA/YmcA/DUF963 family)
MDAIQAARDFGKAIQQDERYLRIIKAQELNDNDAALQAQIESFHALRAELNVEIKKEDKDAERIKTLDAEVKELYSAIFENPNMIEFTEARAAFQEMFAFINQIVQGSASGDDPDGIEFQASCGGDCSGCSGCN